MQKDFKDKSVAVLVDELKQAKSEKLVADKQAKKLNDITIKLTADKELLLSELQRFRESRQKESPLAGPSPSLTSVATAGDRETYERALTRFKEGDLDGARQGLAEFLIQHPHSDLAPNARYWVGECYYGKKDYPKAIDAYDQVVLNHPTSEKVPAALLKKGYAYLALKDRKRATSSLQRVIDLYPHSPEANKAIEKLSQLSELRAVDR